MSTEMLSGALPLIGAAASERESGPPPPGFAHDGAQRLTRSVSRRVSWSGG